MAAPPPPGFISPLPGLCCCPLNRDLLVAPGRWPTVCHSQVFALWSFWQESTIPTCPFLDESEEGAKHKIVEGARWAPHSSVSFSLQMLVVGSPGPEYRHTSFWGAACGLSGLETGTEKSRIVFGETKVSQWEPWCFISSHSGRGQLSSSLALLHSWFSWRRQLTPQRVPSKCTR